jgi:hypothetical protein
MGWSRNSLEGQMTPDGRGGYMPAVMPIQQTLPLVPGMVGGAQGAQQGGGQPYPVYIQPQYQQQQEPQQQYYQPAPNRGYKAPPRRTSPVNSAGQWLGGLVSNLFG